jgi:O-methyltransferase
MFALAVLKASHDFTRRVWLCDSFDGLPNTTSMDEAFWQHSNQLKVPLSAVQENFRRIGLDPHDKQLRYLR